MVVCPFVLFLRPLCCLFVFDLWILITPLASSNSSFNEWVCDCVFLRQMRLFSAISWRYKVLFDELIMMPALNQTNTLSCILIVPVHWNNSPRVDMSRHPSTLSLFNYSLLFLFITAYLSKKQKIPIPVFGLTRLGLVFTIYHTRAENANHYTTDVVMWALKSKII
jgi:hypothetical protein